MKLSKFIRVSTLVFLPSDEKYHFKTLISGLKKWIFTRMCELHKLKNLKELSNDTNVMFQIYNAYRNVHSDVTPKIEFSVGDNTISVKKSSNSKIRMKVVDSQQFEDKIEIKYQKTLGEKNNSAIDQILSNIKNKGFDFKNVVDFFLTFLNNSAFDSKALENNKILDQFEMHKTKKSSMSGDVAYHLNLIDQKKFQKLVGVY